jgi:exonuclease VII small subunit
LIGLPAKALTVFLTLALVLSSPGAASYAVAAQVVGASGKSAPVQSGPAAFPVLGAPVSSALSGSLAAPAGLKGRLSGIPTMAPSVIPGAILSAPTAAPADPEAPVSVQAQEVPSVTAVTALSGKGELLPSKDGGPLPAAMDQLQGAAESLAPAAQGKGSADDAKTASGASFDNSRYVHEGFFGWRKVQGVALDPGLKPLPANATVDQIIDQLSRQFGFSRGEVVSLAAQYRLRPESSAADWLSVYDRLQKINREQFKILDRKKYDGFRNLANRSYEQGWKGLLQRSLEFHKHALGFLIRFPYHVFDTFLFGYFRQNISFEFFHSAENFLDLKAPETKKDKSRVTGVKNPEDDKRQTLKWLEESLRQYAFKGPGMLSGLRARPWFRVVQRYFITPAAEPLYTFLTRRLVLAAASAVAMGVLGAFAPALPLSFALTSIPVLGPAIVAIAAGAPAYLGMVPVIGPFVAPIVTTALDALVKDLVLGPLLNTFILSTMLSLPNAVKEKAFELRKIDPTSPIGPLGWLRAFGQALASGSFWKANLKSFLGMMTVGAEIEAVMGYAGAVDGLIDPAFMKVTGRHFQVFETIGAAVERPQGQSPIPFGGAITWGNVLLMKLQDLTGIQITAWTMHAVQSLRGFFHDSAQNAALSGVSAQAAVGAASQREGAPEYKFDPELYKQGPEAVAARIRELAGQAGHLQQEIAAVQAHMAKLDAELLAVEGRARELRSQSRPITPAEQAEYERLLGELAGKRDEGYFQSKLSELHDLRNPKPEDLERLRELKKLQEHYDALLLPPPQGEDGLMADLSVKEAALKALSEHLSAIAEQRPVRASEGSAGRLDEAALARITTLVSEIESLRGEAKGELANRDAVESLLAVANKSRNLALRERRSGKEMLEFHKNMSRLATVMDLALSLNEINAAQAALKQMMGLLDAKLGRINSAGAANAQGAALNDEMKAQIEKWRREIEAAVAEDDSTKARIVTYEGKSGLAAARLQTYRDDTAALIARINGEDGGASGDALREYQRRIDLLPQVRAWRTDGNPSDPDAFSLKGFQEDLVEVGDYIRRAEDGVSQLQTMPVEFAGVAIVAVPGPEVTVRNPTKDQVLQILADRKVYWQGKRAEYAKSLDTVNRYMDPNNTRTSVDEFGVSAPESLPRWRSQQAEVLSKSQADAQRTLAQIDAMAAQINSVTGSAIPMLSGRTVEDLRSAIPAYGDTLRAVKFPATGTPEVFAAQMNLVSIAKLIPYAARDVIGWAKADATIKAIDKAMSATLPVAQAKLGTVVAMLDAVLADVEADRAYMNNGGDGQALINRKIALLQVQVLPALREAKSLLQDTMIPYQQESIDSAKSDGELFTLFDAQKTLINTVNDLYRKTLPWAFSTYGAAEGDKAEAKASIADFRKTLQDNLDGYDDAAGHSKGVKEYQVEMANRKDPAFTGEETRYGETMYVSMPRNIAKFSAERGQRAGEINTQAAQINEILGRIESLSKGKYNLRAYRLPTDVTGDKAGVAKVQALVDNGSLRGLGDRLGEIGAEANAAAAGGVDMGLGGGDGTVPSGTQAPITVSDNQQIALLALEAAKRLVPSSAQSQAAAPAYYAVARFLFADGIVAASEDALYNQIPVAEAFLVKLSKALSDAVDDTARDDAYADSGGTNETPEQTYARKVATFAALAAVLKEAAAFFDVKKTWDQESFSTLDGVTSYYNSMGDVHSGGATVNASEVEAQQAMRASLQKTYDELEATRKKVAGWMGQLNDPHESALRRVSESVSALQDKTRAVLEANIEYHKLTDQTERSKTILQSMLSRIDDKQSELKAELAKPEVQGALPADLVGRIEALHMGRSAWAFPGRDKSAGAIVVRKAEFGAFLDAVLGMFQAGSPGMDLSAIKADMLKNPQSLAGLIPNSAVMDFGDTADGFYLVYQTRFAVPYGLETSNWVTLGNIAQVWGNNISVSGYQFSSPPNEVNAPYGDKGVEVQVESLQGDNWVNYLNVAFHRGGLDVPVDMKLESQAEQSRILIFDDFAMMLLGDRLYVGLAGFGDFAAQDAASKPSYYGANLKTSFKLTEVMKLNFEQQELFAKDPRTFMQQVNLDFTGYDPDLNQDFLISASGEKKRYSRTQAGPSFDIGRLMDSRDAFTVDLFFARTSGTDDISQKSVGATILKGFTIRGADDKPVAQITNSLTGELGEEYNTVKDRLSVSFPDYGIVVSGDAKILGTAKAFYGEVAKKFGDRTTVSAGYGSPYVGMNNRLSLQMNTSFTLGELWQSVVSNAGQDLKGGETLKQFNKDMDDFFKGDGGEKAAPTVAALRQVFEADVARQLISQDIGALTRDINDLRKAGAILDNTRVRGMVGFVTNPISQDVTDRATGGGFVAGTYTEMTMTKSQKALLEAKSQSLFREGLRLQTRFVDLVKQWQGAVTDLAQSQWELKMAEFAVQNSPSGASRAEAEVRRAQATVRLHEAAVRYNVLSGRDPEAAAPFQNLNAADLETLLAEVRKTIAAPDRLSQVLHSLDRDALRASLGDDPVNLIDWVPFIERFSVGVGVQMQDMMANQILTVGASVRLPVYDPSSKARDNAYVLESRATLEEMSQSYADWRLRAAQEVQSARAWAANAGSVKPGLTRAADDLSLAIRAYRNGIITAGELRQSFASWHWYMGTALETQSRAALADAWAALDLGFAPLAAPAGSLSLSSLDDAFAEISRNAHSLREVALRAEAAAAMTEANDHRIQKANLDLVFGTGLTATGVAWIPQMAFTGFPVMPVLQFELKPEELRELQTAQGAGQTEYFRQLKTRLEADLALRFTQNLLAYQTGVRSAAVLERRVIPQLEAALAAEQARAAPGAASVAATAAARRLDEARGRLEQSRLAARQALAAMNYLMGRPEGSELRIELDGEAALAALDSILAAKDPVAAQRSVLASRVEVARAVETMVDKDLKVEQLAIEPVSLVVRTLGRLFDAIGSQTIGNPDLVAAARVQTLTEERAQAAFDKDRLVQAARARTELASVRGRLAALHEGDPADALEREVLRGRELALRASLAALGEGSAFAKDRSHQDMPASFAELQSRLGEARRGLAGRAPETPVELMAPETLQHRSAAFLRYYHARSTLDQEVRIDKDFAEGWIEVRLRSPDTPPEVLMALARLRQEKADRIHRNELGAATAQASMLSARFETDVRLWRWVQGRLGEAGGAGLTKYAGELRGRLLAEAGEMAALLDLDPALEPGARLERLMSLVPRDAGGGRDLAALGDGFISDVRARGLDEVKRALFDGGLPAGLGDGDGLIDQLRADTIAERMSYKGFTPVAAFGVFRGQSVGSLFLEAPDPQSIERGLTNIVSDVLRKELQSTGRMKELSLRLSELMVRVQDGTRVIEARRKLIQAAESEYRAQLGQGRVEEARLAQEELFSAWLEFSRSLAETKSAFIALVSELEALGQARATGLRAASGPLSRDMPELRKNPRAELTAYVADRLLDPEFASRLDALLAELGPGVTLEQRQRLAKRASLYRDAVADGEAVMIREFTPAERLRLLTLNDKEGKRQAAAAQFDDVLSALGRLDARSNPAWAKLLPFLRQDLQSQAGAAGRQRVDEVAIDAALRDAYWHAVPAPFAVEGAFQRLEKLHAELVSAKQVLLESYLTDLSADPSHFILKDLHLDRYLKAEAAFDAELIKTFESAEVRGDGSLARGLDGIYDLRRSLRRTGDDIRSGRGLRALDALIMLEESRLAAERWQGAGPEALGRTALALQGLRETKARWEKGQAELAPLYGLTTNAADGRRLWTIDGWLTTEQVSEMRAKGLITERGGRLFLKDKEVLGGVDVGESARDRAAGDSRANQESLDLHDSMQKGDFVANAADGRTQVLSFAEVFGPQGLAGQGRLFFFDAPQPGERAGALHKAVHPLTALARAPEASAVYVYTGGEALARGLFPTLESLQGSPEYKDFSRVLVTAKGAEALMSWSRERGSEEARRGWLEVKLNGFGFARDAAGRVSELYQTEDDFRAALKSFQNAARDLRSAREELAGAERRASGLQEDADAKKEAAERAGLDYQRRQAEVRAELRDAAYASVARERGESEQLFEARRRLALDKAVAADRGFKAAQKEFEPVAKAASESSDRLRAAKAEVENQGKAVAEAEKILEHSRTWSLYRSADLALGLDAQGRVAAARAPPVYGGLGLDESLGGGAVRTVTGELLAAVVDEQGGVRAITDPEEFARAAETWTLKSVAMRGSETAASADGRTVRPTYRMSHYEADGLPVLLSSRFLAESLDTAQSKAWKTKYWPVMPYNWGNIVLEIPRGIVGAPIELLTGRDPRQHHYLGRAYMYKTEGGETEHYGFFRKVVNVVDVLNLLPDPVGRYYDPSQFPATVQVDSRILPGENILDKSARDPERGKDIHFGVKSVTRIVDHSVQDLLAARERTLARFHGGSEEVVVAQMRGRDGSYLESRRVGRHGADGVREALGDPLVALDPASDGTGRGEVSLAAEPDNLAVERVERRVRVIAGVGQYSSQEEALKGYSDRLAERAAAAGAAAPGLAAKLESARAVLSEALGLRDRVRGEEDALWQSYHELAWRIAAQRLLEAELVRLEALAADLRGQKAWWQGYLGHLQGGPAPQPNPQPGPQPGPNPPQPGQPFAQFWVWVAVLAGLGALASALWHWLRRRRVVVPA